MGTPYKNSNSSQNSNAIVPTTVNAWYQSPSHSVTLDKAPPSQTLGVYNSHAACLRAVTPASTHLSTPTM